ncbi:D-glycero-alpha-D-manno-heptose 7-phosphate kinase [Shimia sp. SK013]|uniref:GHMP family kinase ATP-binding protein n=1 Tax=Shimia sp. SK013 TaxID=1389006 RepID=UPI0006B521B1|nr:hypothetical protein [Shimia sp. SK013]KPA20546.1 D-glycero-alpha-D-manno-heptose 7-phosphate kinase [Shimia sp. SK013]
MIVVRTPFRISFVGGGTDLPYFFEKYGGCVLSMAFQKYSYLSLHKGFHDRQSDIKYSRTETVKSIDEIQHPIIREVFGMYDINGVDFASAADIPSGTGLASSSAFTCGLLRLCDAYTGRTRSQLDIAEAACDVEINRLGEPIGKQDQYGCALPGLKKIEFATDGKVTASPVLLDDKAGSRVQDSLLMVYCGGSRSASKMLTEQQKHVTSSEQLNANLQEMAQQARDLTKVIATDPDVLGEYLRDGWERKKRLSPHVSNAEIDALYDRALAAGARGGKLLGAGGAGFLLLHAPGNRDAVREALAGEKVDTVKMDMAGTTVIYNDQDALDVA